MSSEERESVMTDGVRYVQTVSRIMSEIALQTRF